MKTWNAAEIVELNITETAHNWTGIYRDGGYIGDGEISGHLSWSKPETGDNNNGEGNDFENDPS